jgi:hypothetical protein
MGEYYVIADLDRSEYISGHSIGVSGKLDGILGEPVSGMLVWLLAKTAYIDKPPFQGRWSEDRIIVAGDEGDAAELFERCRQSFMDITIPVFEEYLGDNPFRQMEYWERGLILDDGRFVPDAAEWPKLAAQRRGKGFPFRDGPGGVTSDCNSS